MIKGIVEAVVAQFMPWLRDKIVSCFPRKRFQHLEDDLAAIAAYPDGLEPDASRSQWNDWAYHREMLEFRLNKLRVAAPTTGSGWLRLRILSAQGDLGNARKEFPFTASRVASPGSTLGN